MNELRNDPSPNKVAEKTPSRRLKKSSKNSLLMALAFVINFVIFFLLPVLSALAKEKNPKLEVVQNVAQVASINQSPKKQKQQKKRKMKEKKISHQVVDRVSDPNARFELSLGALGNTGSFSGGDGFSDIVYEEGEVDLGPQTIQKAYPAYPPEARNQGIEGYVEFKITIGLLGNVDAIELLKEVPRGYKFAEEARKAVRQWKFTPAEFKGIPVRCYRLLRLNFKPN